MSTIIIQRLDDTQYDLDALGFRVKQFNIPLNNYSYAYQQIGKYGSMRTDSYQQYLVIPLILTITAEDINDYNLQLFELRRILRSDEDFYVINSAMPYMRWKCRAQAVTPVQNGNFWRSTDVTINLDCADGYAESVATTLTFDSGVWGFGQNLPTKNVSYEFTVSDFIFNNLGMIPLMADEQPVKIIFNGDAPNGFSITNKTTSQLFKLTRGVSYSDTVIINGIIPLINGQQAYKDSNHGYLDFAIGENQIHVDGASNFDIKFDTRFYY